MSALVWDAIGERTFESGVSKAAIYLEDGRSIVWNGLTEVTEGSDRSATAVHFDGVKITDFVSAGDFSGTILAYTYPDEMLEIEGYARVGAGIHLADQQGESFNLSYQTRVGNDLEGLDAGYKIHILYNVTAIPSERTYETLTNTVAIEPFEWAITTVPEEVPGFRPTSRVIIDSRYTLPDILEQIEIWLYGKDVTRPSFPSFQNLLALILNNYVIDITDLKDGRWTATSNYDGYISVENDGTFQISDAEATYIDPETYDISDTLS